MEPCARPYVSRSCFCARPLNASSLSPLPALVKRSFNTRAHAPLLSTSFRVSAPLRRARASFVFHVGARELRRVSESDGARGAHRGCLKLRDSPNPHNTLVISTERREKTHADVIRDDFFSNKAACKRKLNSASSPVAEMFSPYAFVPLLVFCLSGFGKCADTLFYIQHVIRDFSLYFCCCFVLFFVLFLDGFVLHIFCGASAFPYTDLRIRGKVSRCGTEKEFSRSCALEVKWCRIRVVG